jgi:hypothetical protein
MRACGQLRRDGAASVDTTALHLLPLWKAAAVGVARGNKVPLDLVDAVGALLCPTSMLPVQSDDSSRFLAGGAFCGPYPSNNFVNLYSCSIALIKHYSHFSTPRVTK